MKKFSSAEAIKFGWDTLKKNIWFFISLLIIVFLLKVAPTIISGFIQYAGIKNAGLDFIIIVVGFAVSIIVSIGLTKILIQFSDNRESKLSDIFSCWHLFFEYLIGSILYALIVIGGLILFIVPGVIWALQFYFYNYFIADEGIGPIKALKKSSEITKGIKRDLGVFLSLLFCINLLGFCVFFIGLFISIPITMLATAFVYRKLAPITLKNVCPQCGAEITSAGTAFCTQCGHKFE